MDDTKRLFAAKQRAIEARDLADKAAADYRVELRETVSTWRYNGLSLRKCADKLGISEGALRDLLRPEGMPRRRSKRNKNV